jgi:GNAT superfamily N-acetyltransferase
MEIRRIAQFEAVEIAGHLFDAPPKEGATRRFHGRGVGKALVSALADLARDRDCYGMWVITDEGNEAAVATYSRTGGLPEKDQVVFVWTFDQG